MMYSASEWLALRSHSLTDHSVESLLETDGSRRERPVDRHHLLQFPVVARVTSGLEQLLQPELGSTHVHGMTSLRGGSHQFPAIEQHRQRVDSFSKSGLAHDDVVTSSVLGGTTLNRKDNGNLKSMPHRNNRSPGTEVSPSWIADERYTFRSFDQLIKYRNLPTTGSNFERHEAPEVRRWFVSSRDFNRQPPFPVPSIEATSDDSTVTSSEFLEHDVMRSLSLIQPTCGGKSSQNGGVGPRVELEAADLWRQFHQLTTEMVITKSGRFVVGLVRFRKVADAYFRPTHPN